MPVLPFRLRKRADVAPATERSVIRVRDTATCTWRSHAGSDALRILRQHWPRHGSRVAVLLGSNLDAATVEALRVVHRTLGVGAVDRADGACHAPAGAVISAALGAELMTPDDLVRAECILAIGDPTRDDRILDAPLSIARAAGVPILALGGTDVKCATAIVPVAMSEVASLMRATVRALLAEGAIDRPFVTTHTRGFGAFLADLEADAEPDRHRHDMYAAAALQLVLAAVRDRQRIAVVWRPTTNPRDAMIARAVTGLLLVRGAVARAGAGLCISGPVAESSAARCCAVRGSARDVGIGAMPQPLGVIERVRLGDVDVLVTIGDNPFEGVDRTLEREALDAVAALVHIGTLGSGTLPVPDVPMIVLPGPPTERLHDLLQVLDPTAAHSQTVTTPAVIVPPRDYVFVARTTGERPRRAS